MPPWPRDRWDGAAEAGTDVTFRAEILSYSRNRGAFAGLSAGGGSLHIDKKVNADYYGEPVMPPEILAAKSDLKPPTISPRSEATAR